MKAKNYFPFTIFVLAASAMLSGCVGTIKTADPATTKALTAKDESIQNYPGIEAAVASADSKIEVFFPAIDGDTDNIAYVIRFSGQQIPIYVQASSLTTNRTRIKPFLKYTVTGLQIDSRYDFTVQARNIVTGNESTNTVSKGDRTFFNVTAIFSGVTEVRYLTGSSGLNGLEVFWNEAQTKATLSSSDPTQYRITVLNAARDPDAMNSKFDPPLFDYERKVYTINKGKRSAVINGLLPGTKYYIQVRAIHSGYNANSSNPNYKVEENTNYIEKSTYTDQLGAVNFDEKTFDTAYPPGAAGLYSLNAKWLPPIGNFDHYRIYYSIHQDGNREHIQNYLNTVDPTDPTDPTDPLFNKRSKAKSLCLGPESDNTISCDYVDYRIKSYLLTGLKAYQTYDVVFVVCLTTDCKEFNKKIVTQTVRNFVTNPEIATFKGITYISSAENISDLDRLFLNFSAPDFNSGNVSGLIVDYIDKSGKTFPLNDPSSNYTGSLKVENFDFTKDTKIAISGIDISLDTSTDPATSREYCFVVYPYSYSNDGLIKYGDKADKKCKTPTISPPSSADFLGLNLTSSKCLTLLKNATLNWVAPLIGIFEKYEVYYKQGTNEFSFSDAESINSVALGYKKIAVDSTLQTNYSLTITNLPVGNYKFGVVTSYQSTNIDLPIIRSFNTRILSCGI